MSRTHEPPEDWVHPVKVYDTERRRLAVKHFLPTLGVGDYLIITDTDGLPRRYFVMANERVPEASGVWYAELIASPRPATILGRTYSAA